MKAIILAAGKGSRLGAISKGKPKCLIDIEGNTLLEIQINTLHACGIDDVSVVRGYAGDRIDIPGLTYFDNPDYTDTNILHSLFCAREAMTGPLLILYSDIIYEEQVVRRLVEARHDIAVGVMVNWKDSTRQRSKIALEELEMVYFDSENRVQEIGKRLTDEYETRGQFIGMVKCSRRGAELLKKNYDRMAKFYPGQADLLKKAWMTDIFQEMTELGVPLHCVIIERGWMEIDTPDDYERALTDTHFIRRLVKITTDWDQRARFYDRLEWAAKNQLLDTIVDMAGISKEEKVLDLGTGTGKILIASKKEQPDAEYFGIDISRSMLEKIDPSYGFDLSIKEMEDLRGFADGDFDVLTARMVFHHARNLERAMDEVHRVLKPGGRFILCEGNPPDRYSLPFYESMFRFKEDRITFLLDDLVNLLGQRGFKNITSRTVILRQMSMNNWLENSGLPFRNIDIIRKMHYECDAGIQKAYNMTVRDDDILMDWKFSVVSGVK
ncbi:MAG: NTP transferase domain-containing protein [Candidatus Euphemobacter frigidus]|nr:NTP transferase domain-containing protein [Candidatus Euphemobacter frigidus]MDP8275481.1 NTP transferase domain-containing protein [Candidatus Euphemobacter frigidus]